MEIGGTERERGGQREGGGEMEIGGTERVGERGGGIGRDGDKRRERGLVIQHIVYEQWFIECKYMYA